MQPRAARTAGPHDQRGAAALLMILTLIVILTIVLAPRLTLWQVHNAAAGRGYQSLLDAKAAILAHAANPGADTVPGRRLGQIALTPDLPVLAGTGFNGLSKPGCATRTWAPGQALIDPNTYGAPLNVRCFGRFPWLSFGLQGPSTPDDQLGEVPWIFMSANLVVGQACLGNLNPLMLSSAYTGGCGTTVPFPWLRVVEQCADSQRAHRPFSCGLPRRIDRGRRLPRALCSGDLQQCRLYRRQRSGVDFHRCAFEHKLGTTAQLLRAALRLQRSSDIYHRERVLRGHGTTRAIGRSQYLGRLPCRQRLPALFGRQSVDALRVELRVAFALRFAANAVLFSPGRAIQIAPYAASKGAPQAPLGSGSLADFLDSASNVAGPPFDAAGTPLIANYDDRMYGIL
jgi:hypothetical protein